MHGAISIRVMIDCSEFFLFAVSAFDTFCVGTAQAAFSPQHVTVAMESKPLRIDEFRFRMTSFYAGLIRVSSTFQPISEVGVPVYVLY